MTDTATQFIAMLKEENALDAMQVIKAALSEQARAEVAKTQIEVAQTFKLAEKAKDPEGNQEETENDNNDKDGKSDTDSVGAVKDDKDKE
jgi:hypothetical protein